MKAWLAAIEAKFVTNWREHWRYWSVRLGVIGSIFVSWFVAFPESALHAWAILPDDIKAMAVPVLAHRIFIRPELRMKGQSPQAIVTEILDRVPVPLGGPARS